jgi:small-conductance mechanosensitive channel
VTVDRITTALLLLAEETPSPSPSVTAPTDDCLKDQLCRFVFNQTGSRWLADGGFYLLLKPLRIVLIVVLAVVLRYVAQRLIHRVIQGGQGDEAPARTGLFRPLRDRMPSSLQEATGLRSERRRQRSRALSSILQSVASITIFSLAAMLILGELGVQLGPIIASAGIVGVALGFGAQNLVKDFIAGLFMLLEDQYGVGDVVDVGEASGTVEAVGLRITTIRDVRGVLWYIRNGEIVRVGNKSQGWAVVVVDVPIGFNGVEEATAVLRAAALAFAADPEFAPEMLEEPEVLGVEQLTVDGAVVRATVKTSSEQQWRMARELRRRLTEALENAGITAQINASRVFVRPPSPTSGSGLAGDPTEHGVGGAT